MKPETHYQFSDEEFILKLINCSLNADLFSHEAHLRFAWILIRKHGIYSAEELTTRYIKNYVASLNAEHNYNETLTLAAIKTVNHFILKSESKSFMDFILEFPRLKYNFKSLIRAHYSFDIFTSKEAKRTFIEPDLLPYS